MNTTMKNMLSAFGRTRLHPQLVHCITNYVTVNDCANVLLAMGSSPIMADDIGEAAEITGICSALVINIGTLNSRTVESMIAAGKRANELGHPVVLDPVGAGASTLRTETTRRLLKEIQFAVIRGNISEIKTVSQGAGTTKGVDADTQDAVHRDNLGQAVEAAKALSKKTGAIVAITGAMDIVADDESAYVIENGHPDMSKITGTGCMLTAMAGAYAGANLEQPLEGVACAVLAMGVAGEMAAELAAAKQLGTGSLRTMIIDMISKMTEDILSTRAQISKK